MRNVAAFACSMALSAGAAGCMNLEHPTAPQQSQLVVHSVVDTRYDKIVVLVARARTGAARTVDGIGDDEPATDATVTITAPNGKTMVARNAPGTGGTYGPGVYAVNPSDSGVRLADGGAYALHVQTSSEGPVSGTTTTPQPPAWRISGPTTFVPHTDTLRVSWPRVPGARSYEFVLADNFDGQEVRYRTFTDTSISLPGTALTLAGDDVFPSFGPLVYMVEAVDVNYYDYYRMQTDPFAGIAPSHLEGAVGVFGSVVPVVYGQLDIRQRRP